MLLALALAITVTGFKPTTDDNMNGAYLPLQNTPDHDASNWSRTFKDYPGGVEYFEVYSDTISSTYGEVFWKPLPNMPLPEALVKRFAGKGMAIVGFEADQVRRGAGPDGTDASVPINVAYNHHYGLAVVGAGASVERVKRDPTKPETMIGHDAPGEPGYVNIPVEHTPDPNGLPTSGLFGYNNGGEFRKSYHGLAPPFAQIIASPREVHFGPMQIDTWNREKMDVRGGKFVPGPVPKNSLAPTEGVDAIYSGLLECPLTTRIRKVLTGGGWNDSYVPSIGVARCPGKPLTATPHDCFSAAASLELPTGLSVINNTGTSATLPAGCSVQISDVSATVFFNRNNHSDAGCGSGATGITGIKATNVGVTLGLNLSAQLGAIITLSGPADGNWFGVALNTNAMANAPYAITVDGTTGAVTERVLGDHSGGISLNKSVSVLSNTISHGVRTLVLSRPLTGLTPQHHTFDATKMSLPFITAVGSSASYGFHKAKTVDMLALWPQLPTPVVGGNVSFFAGQYQGGMRNNWNGEVGYEFVVGSQPLTITALGRGTNGVSLHANAPVTVWDVATRKPVVNTVVGPHSGVVEDGYTFANLAQSVMLKAGKKYRITQSCSKNMTDTWPDATENAGAARAGLASLGSGVYIPQKGQFPTEIDPNYSTGRWAGIVTFKIDVQPAPAPPPAATCVCLQPAAPYGKGAGSIEYLGGPANAGETIGFPERCQGIGNSVVGESVFTSRNPTCDIRTYSGGLSVCHHGWHLLDADQEVPWQDQPLEYVFKFRFYFQEYGVQEQHVQAFDQVWGIGGQTGEYDVPRCAPGTPVKDCLHVETGVFTPGGTDLHFVAAHFHCHAPTCVSQELRYGNETGKLLCKETPYHGQGADPSVDRFDELGYIAQRVCLWGSPPLAPPPLASGVKLWYKAVTNNTYGHHGEMALPQMLLASLPK